jgi:hypothetical protein
VTDEIAPINRDENTLTPRKPEAATRAFLSKFDSPEALSSHMAALGRRKSAPARIGKAVVAEYEREFGRGPQKA